MTDIAYESVLLRRAARETNQIADQWLVGGYARNELCRFFSAQSGTLTVSGPNEMRFMGLPVVIDRNLPDRRVVLQAGRNTVGAFTV